LLLGDVDYGASAGTANNADPTALAPRAALFQDWAPLKGSKGEILYIRDAFEGRFPDSKMKVLKGADATESALRQLAPKHQILHLATHGFFAPPQVKSALAPAPRASGDSLGLFDKESVHGFNPGLLSGIVLAGANKPAQPGQDDGILTALEVANLDLRKVNLVVLSACKTGLGEVAGGEGVLGLQRAFQVAGAKTTVTSLWDVPDSATRELMERFYESMWDKKKPLSKLEALRQAQLWMLREGPSRGFTLGKEKTAGAAAGAPPYYWAAFTLSGDWR
jgi:CHAT domain-containing protein